MKSSPGPFGMAALADLRTRTEYEVWLLEAIYEIVDQSIAVEDRDELIYPPSGKPPTQALFATVTIGLGNWRQKFLNVGAPLVFVVNFKILDMLVDWILSENGFKATFRFSEKIKILKKNIVFPLLISRRPWLQDRLIALYEKLEPLRGTIIHDRHFQSKNGSIKISSSKKNILGPAIQIVPSDLRNIAFALVSILRCIDGNWTLDNFREKVIRRCLDELAHLHGLANLGQDIPGFLNVRIYMIEDESLNVDLVKIQTDIAEKRPGQDMTFNLRVVWISADGMRAGAFLIPANKLSNSGGQLQIPVVELNDLVVPLPPSLDLKLLAKELTSGARQA